MSTPNKPTNLYTSYSELESNSIRYWGIFSFFGLLALGGLFASNYIRLHGHYVTGMNNQIVWGIPHVFAIFLIVSASGAANIASIGTVFKKQAYQTQGRLSLLIAVSLLLGGLVIILLDLGRIGNVVEILKGALNFKSVFTWNIFLYAGFISILAIYIWTMMDRTNSAKSFYLPMGFLSFVWRFILTMGTGSIFGVLLAREYYNIVIMAPLFIATSYVFGTAVFSVILVTIYKFINKQSTEQTVMRLITKLRYSLPLFILVVLFFELIRVLISVFIDQAYGAKTYAFLGNEFSSLFWLGQILLGSLLPMFLLWSGWFKDNAVVLVGASVFVVIGGFIQLYIIIIGGQSYPLELFPNTLTSSSFSDGAFNTYTATLPEYLLGFGGIGISICLLMLGMKLLRILPSSIEVQRTNS